MRNQPPVEVWLVQLSTGACRRCPKAIVVDTEGTQTIYVTSTGTGVATSPPASKSTSSSPGERLDHKSFDEEVEFARRS